MKVCVRCQITKELEEFSKRRSVCKQCRREYMANLRKNNPEKVREISLRSYYKNQEKEKRCQAAYRATERAKEKKRIRELQYRQDPINKLKRNYSSKIRKIIHHKKSGSCHQYLGCTFEELKIHLESLFQEGMNWENYGSKGWHVDHIIPLSSAKTYEEVIELSNYKNLQPLWWHENLTKGKKMLTPVQK